MIKKVLAMEIIRPYLEDDKENVISLWKSCNLIREWNKPGLDIERKSFSSKDFFLVIEKDNKIIASIMIGYDGHRGVLNYLAVDAKFRNQGLGSRLVKLAEDKLKDLGCPKINLLVRVTNIEVKEFYKKLGFEMQEDVVIFGKRLISDSD